jgi:hypothetical protein
VSTKKIYTSFVAVIPTVLLGCAQPESGPHRNPPPIDNGQPQPKTLMVKPPEPPGTKSIALNVPPVSYGPRKVQSGGECYVTISGNPPQQRLVSCTAPIEPPPYAQSTWCQVASAEDPTKKIPVACEGDDMKK